MRLLSSDASDGFKQSTAALLSHLDNTFTNVGAISSLVPRSDVLEFEVQDFYGTGSSYYAATQELKDRITEYAAEYTSSEDVGFVLYGMPFGDIYCIEDSAEEIEYRLRLKGGCSAVSSPNFVLYKSYYLEWNKHILCD